MIKDFSAKLFKAQYGNILRLEGEDESKITPEDEHKQLIVIDFEYANANVPGLEFANHFVCQKEQLDLRQAD